MSLKSDQTKEKTTECAVSEINKNTKIKNANRKNGKIQERILQMCEMQ